MYQTQIVCLFWSPSVSPELLALLQAPNQLHWAEKSPSCGAQQSFPSEGSATFLRCPHIAQWPITCPEMLLASTVFFFFFLLDLDEQTHDRTWYLTSEMVAKRAWWCNMEVQGNYFPIVQLQPVGNGRMGELRGYNAFLSFFPGWLLRPSGCLGGDLLLPSHGPL